MIVSAYPNFGLLLEAFGGGAGKIIVKNQYLCESKLVENGVTFLFGLTLRKWSYLSRKFYKLVATYQEAGFLSF